MIGSRSRPLSLSQLAAWIAAALIQFGLWGYAHANTGSANSAGTLRSFLQKKVGWGPASDKAMRYSFARVSLDGNRQRQILVYVSGPGWCGSGGCTAFLLEPLGSSFKVIDRFTLARLPVRILPSKTHGWYDLTMPVVGGGIINGYTALLKFNGHKYPSNPSMAPKLPANLAGKGTEVPLSENGSLVYQQGPRS